MDLNLLVDHDPAGFFIGTATLPGGVPSRSPTADELRLAVSAPPAESGIRSLIRQLGVDAHDRLDLLLANAADDDVAVQRYRPPPTLRSEDFLSRPGVVQGKGNTVCQAAAAAIRIELPAVLGPRPAGGSRMSLSLLTAHARHSPPKLVEALAAVAAVKALAEAGQKPAVSHEAALRHLALLAHSQSLCDAALATY